MPVPPTTPPFERVAIVGVGLIGGSTALAVREVWPSVRLVGVDRPSVLAHALGQSAIDRGVESVAALDEVDLIVLAAPVRQNVRLLADLASARSRALVTDVGGTKRDIVRAARTTGLASCFVGGHPIGGAERGGFGFARPDLFRGRPWILTPEEDADSGTVARLEAFVSGLGARPVRLDADQHDRLMAYLSHLPQLAVSALMDTVGSAVHAEGLTLAGRGLVDTTRLASSPADVWREISSTNADALALALDALIERLSDLRADLARGEALQAVFEGAGRWRAELVKGRDPR